MGVESVHGRFRILSDASELFNGNPSAEDVKRGGKAIRSAVIGGEGRWKGSVVRGSAQFVEQCFAIDTHFEERAADEASRVTQQAEEQCSFAQIERVIGGQGVDRGFERQFHARW